MLSNLKRMSILDKMKGNKEAFEIVAERLSALDEFMFDKITEAINW